MKSVVKILGHRAPGEEYKSVHPPLDEMDEPDDIVRELVTPIAGAKAGDRIRYIQSVRLNVLRTSSTLLKSKVLFKQIQRN